jgi:hypothetical protein
VIQWILAACALIADVSLQNLGGGGGCKEQHHDAALPMLLLID